MKYRVGALVLLAVLFGATACGSGRPAPTVPSKSDSYAWQPVAGGPSLVCTSNWNTPAPVQIDFRSRPYFCKLPAPTDRHGRAGIDFFGPTTTAAGPVPLGPHALRIYMNVWTPRPAVLRVDFGDGAHWQRAVPRGQSQFFNVVHGYAPTENAFILVTLRDKTGYLAVEGEGPFRAPLPGPRPRYCSRVTNGKGGWLTATTSLTCTEAERLFAESETSHPHGYRCVETGLGPWGSDTGVYTCRRGTREFVYTTYA